MLRYALLSLLTLSACAPVVVTGGTAAGVAVAQERTVGHAVDDAGILITIKNLFFKSDVYGLFTDVHVEVVEGRVLLTGSVEKPETAIEAIKLSWRAEGVREVINELQVVDKSSLTNAAKDTWITSQIKSKLLFTKRIRSINYSVATINGTVYLIGIAQNQEELDNVSQIARTTSYVQQVISHVRLKDDTRRP